MSKDCFLISNSDAEAQTILVVRPTNFTSLKGPSRLLGACLGELFDITTYNIPSSYREFVADSVI